MEIGRTLTFQFEAIRCIYHILHIKDGDAVQFPWRRVKSIRPTERMNQSLLLVKQFLKRRIKEEVFSIHSTEA